MDGFDMRHAIALTAAGLALAGCTSSWLPSADFLKPAPMTQTLRFESEPSNAEARISPTQACQTPCELTLTPTGDLSVTYTLQGYETQIQAVKLLSPDDPQSGSTEFRLYPNPVYAELEASPPAARTTRPAKKSAPKRAPAPKAAAPKRAPAPAAAAPNPIVAPEPAAAPAAAAPRPMPAAPPANSPFPPAPAAQFPPPPAPSSR